MQTSPWWTSVYQYTAPISNQGPTITLAGECVDTENEGTFFDCPGSNNAGGTVVDNNVTPSGCALPADPNGLYLTMPSYTDVSLNGAGGCHATQAVGSGGSTDVTVAIALYQNFAYGPGSPGQTCTAGSGILNLSGFPCVDGELGAFGHEMAEAISHTGNPNLAYGWFCSSETTEIADNCEGTTGIVSGYTYTTSAGQPASWGTSYLGTHYDFIVQPLVQLNPYNACGSVRVPASVIGAACSSQAQCLVTYPGAFSNIWQNNCVSGHCVAPTCSDGVVDGDESDTDCGGSCQNTENTESYRCATGKACRSPGDCATGICTSSVCG